MPSSLPSRTEPEALASLFKAAGDATRVRILALLAHGELCVCDLHQVLGAPQPTVSRHLGVLRNAGLVRGRRDGAWIHYSLTGDAEAWLGPAIAVWREDPALAKDCAAAKGCP